MGKYNIMLTVLKSFDVKTVGMYVMKRKKITRGIFFLSRNAISVKSFIGTSFCFGRTFATPIKTWVNNHDGAMLSAIYKCCKQFNI